MGTKMGNSLREQVEKYNKAAKVAKAAQALNNYNNTISRIAGQPKPQPNQGQSKQ